MIPQPWIEAWRAEAPWASAALVEQDLVLRPGARYSEDIDLVQAVPAPIGPTFDRVRSVLDPWLGAPKRDLKEGRVNLIYRFTSQEDPPRQLRLKIEINSREQFAVFGHTKVPFEVRSDWFTGSADLTTFHLDELMGTKLSALYQRKKGRDLFDMAMALDHGAEPERIVACFSRYMTEGGHHVTRAQFEQNLHEKRARDVFRGDLEPLLRLGSTWDPEVALTRVLADLVARLPDDPWAGA